MATTSHISTAPQRTGFTLIELSIVMMVIALLAAMTIPAMAFFKKKAAVDATIGLLGQVEAAMEAYGIDSWSTSPTTAPLSVPMWDLNRDGINDGIYDGTHAETRDGTLDAQDDPGLPSNYFGFAQMAGGAINSKHLRVIAPGTHRDCVVDAWGKRIRVAARSDLPLGIKFGVYSGGPDGDVTTTNDNLYSWK